MNRSIPSFAVFRDGPGGELLRRLGLDISSLSSWQSYTQAVIRHNNVQKTLFQKAADFYRTASTGERVLLCAALMAADYAMLADDLQGSGSVWWRITQLDDEVARAVSATILRID